MSQLEESSVQLEMMAERLPYRVAELLKTELGETATQVADVVGGTAHQDLISDLQGSAEELAQLVHERLNLLAEHIRQAAMAILTSS